ncbi:hypothetical protein ASE03_30490 [Kitasatospora sp. Root187]|nr:hypothetical protein ASC99_35970 [Kitasatospora sp. Root107]KRB66960.1 hypothetical protein ASE03_30490 [Kitasatospora sp. Root187]
MLQSAVLREREADQRQLRSLVAQRVLLMGLLTETTQVVTLPGLRLSLDHGPGRSHRDPADLCIAHAP